jgi:hypothetical protein
MPRVGFEPTIAVFEGPKTVHALDDAATVIGRIDTGRLNFLNANQTDTCHSAFITLTVGSATLNIYPTDQQKELAA